MINELINRQFIEL